MRKTHIITAIWLAAAPAAQAGTAFDGQWSVNIVCPAYQDAEGYSFTLALIVQNGQAVGQYGDPGQPGFFTLSGTIADDGTVKLAGSQLTKNPAYSVGHPPAGTRLTFTANGKVDSDSGQATKTETRPCTYYFNKTAF